MNYVVDLLVYDLTFAWHLTEKKSRISSLEHDRSFEQSMTLWRRCFCLSPSPSASMWPPLQNSHACPLLDGTHERSRWTAHAHFPWIHSPLAEWIQPTFRVLQMSSVEFFYSALLLTRQIYVISYSGTRQPNRGGGGFLPIISGTIIYAIFF